MVLTLLHTAQVHCATFDALRDRIAPGAELNHLVRQDWLEKARDRITPALETKLAQTIADAPGKVICTCTTLGPAAETAGAIRVDWPMMQKAAKLGGPIILAYCLDSTWESSLGLLERALAEAQTPAKVHPLKLAQYWPLFEAGQTQGFAAVLAAEIKEAVKQQPEIGCVVLAQASMAGAAPLLAGMGVPVLSSPELALRAGLSQI